MRIVISGTHGSGKSTLISDFSMLHPEWEILHDTYEYIDNAADEPDVAMFLLQLSIASERLLDVTQELVLVERGPIDFLAYLYALSSLGRAECASEVLDKAYMLAQEAMAEVDLLVLLPLNETDAIEIGIDEDLKLRKAMDLALLDLVDDFDFSSNTKVVEIAGNQTSRLACLEKAVKQLKHVNR